MVQLESHVHMTFLSENIKLSLVLRAGSELMTFSTGNQAKSIRENRVHIYHINIFFDYANNVRVDVRVMKIKNI